MARVVRSLDQSLVTGTVDPLLAAERYPAGEVVQVPPAPDSASLFFWALGSLGAWQLSRCSRRLHLTAVPEWYHPGGPAQIGHTTLFDLRWTSNDLPVCDFEQPVGEPAGLREPWLAPSLRQPCQLYLSVAEPRGPPILS